VIFLSDLQEEEELAEWPEIERIVRAKVKPSRDVLGNNPNNVPLKKRWWAYQAHRPSMLEASTRLERFLVHPNVSKNLAFAFVPSSTLVGSPHNVFLLDEYSAFCTLQSRAHESWARLFASSMKDDLRYTPSDCFETFPFPIPFDPTSDEPATKTHRAALEAAGKEYYDFRAALMIRNDQGLTATYNRFHDPEESDLEIQELRALHTAMDRAVLAAYGWTDVPTECAFLLDYEEDEDDDDEGGKRRKKKPWRYRWPDEVRDDVLARLIDLNQERAAEERRLGIAPRQGKALVVGTVEDLGAELFAEDE
jgi:hypothetical protein